ncbi:MAG: transcription antitermination factor NusB [Candidatus Omnitrophota bacterium]
MMRKRTQARECALQILYQSDIRKEQPEKLFLDFWRDNEVGAEVSDFASSLVLGTLKNMKKIDETITSYASNWKLNRMAVIDRNVLRLATYELLFCDDIPQKVSINEAVDLAKKFGDTESGKFVNGILDKISKEEAKSGKAG